MQNSCVNGSRARAHGERGGPSPFINTLKNLAFCNYVTLIVWDALADALRVWWSIRLYTGNTWCEYDAVVARNSVYFLIHDLVLTVSLESRRCGSHLTDGEAAPKQCAQAAQFMPALPGFPVTLSVSDSQLRGGSRVCPCWSHVQHQGNIHTLPYMPGNSDFPFYLLFSRPSPLKYACHTHLNILC